LADNASSGQALEDAQEAIKKITDSNEKLGKFIETGNLTKLTNEEYNSLRNQWNKEQKKGTSAEDFL